MQVSFGILDYADYLNNSQVLIYFSMSKPFRGMSQPQMTRLRPDVVLIEYSDPRAKEIHISTNTYALLKAGRMLLVDINVSLLPYV